MDRAANLFVRGWFVGTNDFGDVSLTDGSRGGEGVWVVKDSGLGALQWVREAGWSGLNAYFGSQRTDKATLMPRGTAVMVWAPSRQHKTHKWSRL